MAISHHSTPFDQCQIQRDTQYHHKKDPSPSLQYLTELADEGFDWNKMESCNVNVSPGDPNHAGQDTPEKTYQNLVSKMHCCGWKGMRGLSPMNGIQRIVFHETGEAAGGTKQASQTLKMRQTRRTSFPLREGLELDKGSFSLYQKWHFEPIHF